MLFGGGHGGLAIGSRSGEPHSRSRLKLTRYQFFGERLSRVILLGHSCEVTDHYPPRSALLGYRLTRSLENLANDDRGAGCVDVHSSRREGDTQGEADPLDQLLCYLYHVGMFLKPL